MPKNYSINISEFSGIFHTMAEKANINGGETLDAVEISIFNDILSTYDKKNKKFIFENEVYSEPNDSVNIPGKPKPFEFRFKEPDNAYLLNNLGAVQKAKNMAESLKKEQDKVINIDKTINGIQFEFSFKKSNIENYIIDNATSLTDSKKIYSDISEIRNKPYSARTKAECKKLNEFNNLINSIVNAGVEYGVDPMFIAAIIQQEVKFDGNNKNSFGNNGKGYMQITGSPIKDILLALADKSKTSRIYLYGEEARKLFENRGFSGNCTSKNIEAEVKKVKQYLIKSKDTDFSIRLGALILRSYMIMKKGNMKNAANAYNSVNTTYGDKVMKIYNNIKRVSTAEA